MILLILCFVWITFVVGILLKNCSTNNNWGVAFAEAICGLFVLVTTVLSFFYIIQYFFKL